MADAIPEQGSGGADEEGLDQSFAADMDRLIARSSLGTPESVRLRRETPAWLVHRILRRSEEIRAEIELPAAIRHREGGLAGADLTGASLAGVDLSGEDLTGANLSDADLSGADLSDARLQQADLSRANLEGAILVNAALDGARLHRTILEEATLFQATMNGVRIFRANLRHAHLRKAAPREAIVIQADLTGADLGEACLRDAFVIDAIVAEANLAEADFDHARIGRVDVTSCIGVEHDQLLVALLDDRVTVPADWADLRRRLFLCVAEATGDAAAPVAPDDGPTAGPQPMLEFGCETLVPDCDVMLLASSKERLRAAARVHARRTHGMREIPPEMEDKIVKGARLIPTW